MQASKTLRKKCQQKKMSNEKYVSVTPTKELLTSIQKNVKCTHEGCDKIFPHAGSLQMHLVKSHREINSEADKRLYHRGNTRRKENCVLQFKCPEENCRYSDGKDRHFSTYRSVKQHYMKIHAEKLFECSKCERNFSRECDLQRHEPNCGVLYQCDSCPVKYTTTESLLTHCKRQDHPYPEKYRKKDKNKATKTSTRNIATIALIPVVIMAPPSVQPKPPPPPKPITPKRLLVRKSNEELYDDKNGSSGMTLVEDRSVARQDALIQTDIFGVNSLSVSGRQNSNKETNSHVGYNQSNHLHLQKRSVSGSSLSPPKKSSAVKRKLGLDKYSNPSSPRRKKMKSSTGMQTSVSCTRKPSRHAVSGTQTTGDYILKTAMAQADIQIERKTVASQVTPQKQIQAPVQHNEKCTIETQTFSPSDSSSSMRGDYSHKPVLVDSFSQVKQRNIWAETSHNLAESQTMTDLPPSISTQTLQSYLVNQQERKMSKKQINRDKVLGHNYCRTSAEYNSASSIDVQAKLNKPSYSVPSTSSSSEIDKDNVVEIYNSSLTSSVSFVAPKKIRRKISSTQPFLKNKGTEIGPPQGNHRDQKSVSQITSSNQASEANEINSVEPEYMTSALPQETDFLESINLHEEPHSVEYCTSHQSTSSDSIGAFGETKLAEVNSTYVEKARSSVTDTEAQAMMSADEFESLLQSSGIFLDSCELRDKTSNPNSQYELSNHPVSISVNKSIGQDFDFLHCGVDMADSNTQTGGDVSLFDGYSSIDTNTQTGGDMNFLDLVMTNMETQTLSEEDLMDLGLSSLNASTATQTLGVDTSDFDWTATQYCNTGSGTADNFQPPTKPLLDSDQGFLVNQSKIDVSRADQSTYSLLYNLDHDKVTSQSETQTVAIDATEPLVQTETQTQVELPDLETINMETQTTLEDLQQLCGWFE